MKNKIIKVLAIGPVDIFPVVDGGKEGLLGALKSLSIYCEVSYLFPSKNFANLDNYKKNNISPLPIDVEIKETLGLLVKSLIKFQSYKFEKYNTKKIQNLFLKEVKDKNFDVIICHFPHLYKLALLYKNKIKNSPIILRSHNIEHEIISTFLAKSNIFLKPFLFYMMLITKYSELSIWSNVDAVSFLTKNELEKAKKISKNKTLYKTCEEGISLPSKEIIQKQNNNNLIILFNPKSIQNRVSLKIFLKKYWLKIANKKFIKDINLYITNSSAKSLSSIVRISNDKLKENRIIPIDFIENLEEFLPNHLATISATFVGAGIRKKILEGMIYKIPILATEFDIESVDWFLENRNILSMKTPLILEKNIIKLKNKEFRNKLIKNAYFDVNKFSSWEKYALQTISLIEELLLIRKY